MARAIWQGSISFGLVEIPVALQSAERPHELDLTMLDRRDFSPVGYARYNKNTEEEVPWDEIVRGYEYEKDQYVVLSDEDLKRANPELTKTVHIERFVDPDEIDPIFLEKPYYLTPMKKRSKGYVLLRETLQRTSTVGIARIAIRTREHVAMVGVRGKLLLLHLLRYADEIREPADFETEDLADARASAKEIQMAVRIVEGMKEKWKAGDYEDQFSNDLLELIERKVASGKVHDITPPTRERAARGGKVIDLMPLLKKSLELAATPSASHARRKSPARGPRSTKKTHVRRKTA